LPRAAKCQSIAKVLDDAYKVSLSCRILIALFCFAPSANVAALHGTATRDGCRAAAALEHLHADNAVVTAASCFS